MKLAEILAMQIMERSKAVGDAKRKKLIAKHLRIADATTGHEREVHLAKAKELQKKI